MADKRGRPREFDISVHTLMTRDQHRRVELFAEQQQVTTAGAYRRLIEIALTELEGVQSGV